MIKNKRINLSLNSQDFEIVEALATRKRQSLSTTIRSMVIGNEEFITNFKVGV